jgi:hypothetical protein
LFSVFMVHLLDELDDVLVVTAVTPHRPGG